MNADDKRMYGDQSLAADLTFDLAQQSNEWVGDTWNFFWKNQAGN